MHFFLSFFLLLLFSQQHNDTNIPTKYPFYIAIVSNHRVFSSIVSCFYFGLVSECYKHKSFTERLKSEEISSISVDNNFSLSLSILEFVFITCRIGIVVNCVSFFSILFQIFQIFPLPSPTVFFLSFGNT